MLWAESPAVGALPWSGTAAIAEGASLLFVVMFWFFMVFWSVESIKRCLASTFGGVDALDDGVGLNSRMLVV